MEASRCCIGGAVLMVMLPFCCCQADTEPERIQEVIRLAVEFELVAMDLSA